MANTTWSTSDKTSSVALTNGNLTATVASGTAQGVRSIDRQVTGKFYWEYTWNGAPGNICCGVANPNAVLSTLGSSVASCLLAATIQGNGVTINNGVQTVSMGGQSSGGVVCVALDLTNQLLWWRIGAAGQWNASASANPATGAGGLSVPWLGGGIPAYALMNTGTVTSQGVTANFGDTAFTGAVPAGFTSGFTKDPTVLLVHADGTNGSTTFTDVSANPHVFSAAFGAAVETAQVKFGTGAAGFASTSSTIQTTVSGSADFNFLSAPFTIEAWAYASSAPSVNAIVAQFNNTSGSGFYFGVVTNIVFWYYDAGGTLVTFASSTTFPTGGWHHVAVDRDVGGTLRIYLDGAVIASTSAPTFQSTSSLAQLNIGNANSGGYGWGVGYIDEVRITNGLARYGGAFTPPTAPFTTFDTNMLTTQAAVEEWATGAPAMQLTQAVVEEWGSVATYSPWTTWSNSDKSSTITVSNSDLTVTSTSTASATARTVGSQISGKFYWEYTFTVPGNSAVGIANQTATLGGQNVTGTGPFTAYANQGGSVWIIAESATDNTSIGAFSAGGIACVAIDLDARLIWFRNGAGNWNGSASANPATGVGGFSVPWVGIGIPAYGLMISTVSNTSSITGNFGASAFSNAVPAGYTAGFPTNAGFPVNTIATQLAADTWAAPPAPAAQLTNISIEQWAQVATVNPQAVVTQIAIDQWATVAEYVPSVGATGARIMIMA